jgi:molybdopterin biosynthesis enzyme
MSRRPMRPIRETISLDDARSLIARSIAPLARTERVRIDLADGRVISAPIHAGTDVPPFARAAMDGFAVLAADTFGAGTHSARALRCVETVFTGQVPTRAIGTGQCTEIATGAPVPVGADAVVMVEDTEKDADGSVRIFGLARPCSTPATS